jgi:lipid II:glycine glycyltransferase (peptidoglycan interpeptide bridge formation enzyme)
MMRLLEATQTGFPTPAEWDRLVAQDPRGHLLQTWAWGELKARFGWSPLRLAVERDGALLAGAQVLLRRVGPCCLAYLPKGPILATEDAAALALLGQGLHAHCRRQRAITLKVEPEWRDEDAAAHARLAAWGLTSGGECIQPRRTIIVDLQGDEGAILARMKQKWRYNIHLSERKGVVVREGGLDELPAFYALMRVTGERDGFAIHSEEYYRQALALFAPAGRARLLMAHHEGQPLAGLMVYAFNHQSWYMYGASANAGRELMPNHQTQWAAMRWARAQGCTQYDFWGIPDSDAASPTAALEGVYRFKSGFGGEVVRYVGAYEATYSAPLAWLLGQAWAWRRRRASQRAQTPNSA